ncbi:MAG: cyclic nucleotide-binding domain-containing protein [Verrucomicrobia bacterium]|nr:cyclic nucleotide-binding domain-containing protein [Verrucomicrobiota bacterium]
MDFNLLISAQPLVLAPQLRMTPVVDGLLVVKNVPACTFLRVRPEHWAILRLFEEPQIVPAVLDRAIRERLCPPLGEFYELILKAERARLLLRPGENPPVLEPSDWRGRLSPRTLGRPLAVLLIAGVGLSFGFRPELPTSLVAAAASLGILIVATSLAACVSACLLRGAGGEVYRPGWWWRSLPPAFRFDPADAVMLPRATQDVILIAEPAVLAAAAGLTVWHAPGWSFFPLLGLILNLRPVLHGRFPEVVRLGRSHELGDAEQRFVFPPNRTPLRRWKLLWRAVGQANTWVRLCYGIIWTLAVIYLAARLTDTPPWSPAFWEAHGVRIAATIGGSLVALGILYLGGETFLAVRRGGAAWIQGLRAWRERWFGHRLPFALPADRMAVLSHTAALRTLDDATRLELATALTPLQVGPWRRLPAFTGQPSRQVAVIASGQVTVRREDPTRRRRRVQVLGRGDLIGLHDVTDPQGGTYHFRTATPVRLLVLPREQAPDLILNRVARTALANSVIKAPFLRGIPLCRHWHLQAIERFAQLSTIEAFAEGDTIIAESQLVERFFVIFAGDAVVSRRGREIAVLRPGQYFGEIGLLQNSGASATIVARKHTRCLAIARPEFLRFVTHNFTVALELERVSSRRLGRPIFPVRQRDLVGN